MKSIRVQHNLSTEDDIFIEDTEGLTMNSDTKIILGVYVSFVNFHITI